MSTFDPKSATVVLTPPQGPRQFDKVVASSATPELLYSGDRVVSSFQLTPGKRSGNAIITNTGTVWVQAKNSATPAVWQDILEIPADSPPIGWPTRGLSILNLNQFKIRVVTNGDGVICEWEL